jgi:predicted DNA-binding protein (MmcQ/YjbR family)
VAASKSSAKSAPALLRQLATALPEVTEGVTCDKAAYKAGGKSFLFVGAGDTATTIMLKLKVSLPEAKKLAAAHPATYKIGGHDWVTITLPHGQPPPAELLQRWIEESYRLLVPKALVAALDGAAAQKSPRARVSTKSKSPKTSTTARSKPRSA